MVAAGRAARQEQLSDGDPRRRIDRLLVDLRPDLVVGRQPVEDPQLLGSRQDAGEGLKEVVVRVDESRKCRLTPCRRCAVLAAGCALPVPRSMILPSLIATQASLSSRPWSSMVTSTSR